MGNAASKYTAYFKLDKELPPLKRMEYDKDWLKVDQGMNVFADEKDREQFIYAVIAVATSNGALDLTGADYKLFYSRRAQQGRDNDLLFASIVAIQEARIVAKIESGAGGKEQRDAFLALRREVEVRMGRILQDVPGASSDGQAGPSSVNGVPSDMPPAYQSSAVDMVGRKEKA